MVSGERTVLHILMRMQKVFKRGRGFLGFTKTIMNDLSTSVKTTITQSFFRYLLSSGC